MQHPIFVIYKNLPAFIEARKLSTTHQFKYDEKGMDELISTMEKVGYMDIKLESKEAKTIVQMIIIYANSELSRQTPKLKQLISTIESSEDFIAGKISELIFIVDPEFIGIKRLVTVFKDKQKDKKYKSYVRLCPYHMFIMDMTKKKDIPKSRIMTKSEIENHLNYNRRAAKDLQTISEKNDPIVTWLGARKGDFIEHEILSRNVGVSYSIRRVI